MKPAKISRCRASLRFFLHRPMVEPDLADRKQAVSVTADELAHLLRLFETEHRRIEPCGRADHGVLCSQIQVFLRIREVLADRNDRRDARRPSAGQHIRAVRIEHRVAQVDVRVHKFAAAGLQGPLPPSARCRAAS